MADWTDHDGTKSEHDSGLGRPVAALAERSRYRPAKGHARGQRWPRPRHSEVTREARGVSVSVGVSLLLTPR